MPKASAVAAELRKFADSLDSNPDVEIEAPSVSFYHWLKEEKDRFLTVAKLIPRPAKKSLVGSGEEPRIRVQYATDAISIYANIPQSATCTLVEPAKPAVYRCDPILSEQEGETLEVA